MIARDVEIFVAIAGDNGCVPAIAVDAIMMQSLITVTVFHMDSAIKTENWYCLLPFARICT